MMTCEGGKKCCGVHWLSGVLLLVGGLNWGLVGLAGLISSGSNWNVVHMILGSWPTVESVVYVLVGLSSVALIVGCRCKSCSEGM